MQIWDSDIIEIVIGPLISHVFEVRLWMIMTFVFYAFFLGFLVLQWWKGKEKLSQRVWLILPDFIAE